AHACTHTHTLRHARVHTNAHRQKNTRSDILMCLHGTRVVSHCFASTHTHMHTHTHTHTHAHTHAHARTHALTRAHEHIHTHTHTHTHLLSLTDIHIPYTQMHWTGHILDKATHTYNYIIYHIVVVS